MIRLNCLAVSGLALLTALFGAPKAPPPIAPAETEEIGAPPPAERVSSLAGDNLVRGTIDGVVNMNGEPVEVNGDMAVRGGMLGPNRSAGIAIAKSPGARGPNVKPFPPEVYIWVVPDSSIDEMVVLTDLGDWATFDVSFATGYLRYDISVVGEDPPAYEIKVSGELKGDPALPALPWHRNLTLQWNADGTIVGTGYSAGRLESGQTYFVPVDIRGHYVAANPAVRIPTKVCGKLAITSYDAETGMWAGRGSRTLVTPSDDVNAD